MNKKPIVQMIEKLGLLPAHLAVPAERNVEAPADSCSSTGSEKRGGNVETWWTEHAVMLSALMQKGGVAEFRVWHEGTKWFFEITPEAASQNAKLNDSGPDTGGN